MKAKSGESTGIRCPRCGGQTGVYRAVQRKNELRRERYCRQCGHGQRFRTIERLESEAGIVERKLAAAVAALADGKSAVCSRKIFELVKVLASDIEPSTDSGEN